MLFQKRTSLQFIPGNGTQLLRAGAPYFDALLSLIGRAQDSIHLQVYILGDDGTGRLVTGALKEAAARGVKVYLLADGYASQGLSKAFVSDLRAAGIQFRFFEPLLRGHNFYFGRRLHHKVVVVDATWGLVGGINIADRYNDLPGTAAWLDFALLVEGPVAAYLCRLCWQTWRGYKRGRPPANCKPVASGVLFPGTETRAVRIRRNDWVRRKNEITATYVSMLRHARSHVTILCSYFLPGKVIRRQIVWAIRRGIQVRVITAGRSDVPVSKLAERWLYDWLLRTGVHLYEYQKNVLHGKIATCDDEWMTIGSYNINNISAHASIELNLDVQHAAFARETRLQLEDIIRQDCIQITPSWQMKSGTLLNRLVRWLSYQLIRVGLYLFTFYFKHAD